MPPLCWRHHTLIQALLSRGPLKEKEFQSIFSDVTGKNLDSHRQLFNEYLRKINMELSCVQFELRACRNQYDGDVYYGVINNVADGQSKLGTKYTVPQIAFYRGIIEAIVQDGTAQGTISNIDALNIQLENQAPSGTGSQLQGASTEVHPAFKNFSMSQKDKTIQEFVQDQWLCTTPDGKIGLGVRSFLDLRSWFHNNEVPPCDVCNEAGIKADLCPNESCNVRIHKYCLKAKFSQKRIEKGCPGCGTQWPYVVAKAEAVEEEDTDVHRPPRAPSIKKRLRSSRIVEEDESNGPSESQPLSQPSGRKKLRSSRDVLEDDSIGPPEFQPSSEPSNRRPKRSRNVEEDESNGPSQAHPSSQASGRKKHQTASAVEVDTVGPGPSQESRLVPETRRVTRTSVRTATVVKVDTVGSGPSQASRLVHETRRVTRTSSRFHH